MQPKCSAAGSTTDICQVLLGDQHSFSGHGQKFAVNIKWFLKWFHSDLYYWLVNMDHICGWDGVMLACVSRGPAAESSAEGSRLDVGPGAILRDVFWTEEQLQDYPPLWQWVLPPAVGKRRAHKFPSYFHKAKSRVFLAEQVIYNQALQALVTAWEMNSLFLLALIPVLSTGRDW